jgi:hypothetical protein
MPLSAKAQAMRRARLKRLKDPKKVRKMRCHNCNKLTPKNRYNQKFCSPLCKREYEQNGGTAFGPLKTRLEKLVRSITGALELRNTFLEKRVTKLEEALRTANETGAAHKPTPIQPVVLRTGLVAGASRASQEATTKYRGDSTTFGL